MPAKKVRTTLSGHTLEAFTLAFSPDGTLLASGSGDGMGRGAQVIVWDVATGRPLRRLNESDWILGLAFSPDGKVLAVSDFEKRLALYGVETGELIKVFKEQEHHKGPLAFSPDGKTLACARCDAILPDKPCKIDLWDWETENVKTLAGHQKYVESLSFSPDGALLASGSLDQSVKIWDLAAEQHRSLGFPYDSTEALFLSDDRLLVSARNILQSIRGEVSVWDAKGDIGPIGPAKPLDDVWNAVAFCPKSNVLAVGTGQGEVALHDPSTLEAVSTLRERSQGDRLYHEDAVLSMAASPDGQRLVTGGADGRVILWDAVGRKPVLHLPEHSAGVNACAWSADARWFVTASGPPLQGGAPFQKGEVRIWDAETGKRLREITADAAAFTALACSPDGKSLAAAAQYSNLRLPPQIIVWDVETQEKIAELTPQGSGAEPDAGIISALVFLPRLADGEIHLISGGLDSTVRLWNVSAAKLVTMKLVGSRAWCLALSPDGKTLASGHANGLVRLWSPGPLAELAALPGHRGIVRAVAFSPDGTQLAAGGLDVNPFQPGGEVRLWRALPVGAEHK